MSEWWKTWWQPPRLHTDDDERRVSWLELFYDLVFVVVIARLAHHLTEHPDGRGLVEFALPFVAVWWVWIGGTYYAERFETYDFSFRVFVLLQMLGVAAMAVFAEHALEAGATGFALAYAASRAVITALWWRAGRHNPPARSVTNVYTLGFSVSVVLWVVSAFVPAPWRFALQAAGLLIDLLTPVRTLPAQRLVFRARASKLPERFGLFVLIVLGESLVGLVNGLADLERLDVTALARFVTGFLVGFGLWWVYFDFVGRREPKLSSTWNSLAWSYLHLPLVMSIAAVGATLTHAVTLDGAALEDGASLLLVGSFAATYFTTAALEWTLKKESPRVVDERVSSGLKVLCGVAALGAVFLQVAPSALLLVLVGLHLVNVAYSLFAWFRSDVRRTNTAYH